METFHRDTGAAHRRLDSWKQISAFLGCSERTVKRWEIERALPVHRLPGSGRGRVFAYEHELTQWLGTGAVAVEEPPATAPVGEQTLAEPVRREDTRFRWPVLAMTLIALAAALYFYERTARTVSGHTPDKEAQNLYLKGRYYWDKRTPDSLRVAVDYFTQSIVKDPGYAKAYVGLADSYNLLREFAAMPDAEAYHRSLAAARKAVELDDSSAEAHASLAFSSFWGSWDFETGLREFRRALELDPKYARAHHWLATALVTLGRFREAATEIERARELDPNSTALLSDKGFILIQAGQTSQGVSLLKEIESTAPEFFSTHHYLAWFYLWSADDLNYLAEAKQAADMSHDASAIAIYDAAQRGLAAGGREGMLQRMLAVQRTLQEQGRVTAYSVAAAYALSGNRPDAVRYLKISLAKREPVILAARTDPMFKNLRGDPGYQRVLAGIGFRD